MYYHVNGRLVPADEATVDVRDRGFMYGDAAFETLRAYGGSVFRWPAHAERLRRTCEALRIDHSLSDADLEDRIDETLAANDLDDAYVRLSITRGVQPGKLTPDPAVDPTVVILVKALPRGGIDGSPVWTAPAVVRTARTRRVPRDAVPADIKTHNYVNGILARLELRDANAERRADEALMLDPTGNVAEGATSNVFFVRDGALRTPVAAGSVLPGVTRAAVLELARAAGLPVEIGEYPVAAIRGAEEAFLTNTTWELRPIESLDGDVLGGGPVTSRLSRRFDELVEEHHY